MLEVWQSSPRVKTCKTVARHQVTETNYRTSSDLASPSCFAYCRCLLYSLYTVKTSFSRFKEFINITKATSYGVNSGVLWNPHLRKENT